MDDPKRRSMVIKRSIVINGHKTSISLEDAFYQILKEMSRAEGVRVADIVAKIDEQRRFDKISNLSSAIRLHILNHCRSQTHQA